MNKTTRQSIKAHNLTEGEVFDIIDRDGNVVEVCFVVLEGGRCDFVNTATGYSALYAGSRATKVEIVNGTRD